MERTLSADAVKRLVFREEFKDRINRYAAPFEYKTSYSKQARSPEQIEQGLIESGKGLDTDELNLLDNLIIRVITELGLATKYQVFQVMKAMKITQPNLLMGENWSDLEKRISARMTVLANKRGMIFLMAPHVSKLLLHNIQLAASQGTYKTEEEYKTEIHFNHDFTDDEALNLGYSYRTSLTGYSLITKNYPKTNAIHARDIYYWGLASAPAQNSTLLANQVIASICCDESMGFMQIASRTFPVHPSEHKLYELCGSSRSFLALDLQQSCIVSLNKIPTSYVGVITIGFSNDFISPALDADMDLQASAYLMRSVVRSKFHYANAIEENGTAHYLEEKVIIVAETEQKLQKFLDFLPQLGLTSDELQRIYFTSELAMAYEYSRSKKTGKPYNISNALLQLELNSGKLQPSHSLVALNAITRTDI